MIITKESLYASSQFIVGSFVPFISGMLLENHIKENSLPITSYAQFGYEFIPFCAALGISSFLQLSYSKKAKHDTEEAMQNSYFDLFSLIGLQNLPYFIGVQAGNIANLIANSNFSLQSVLSGLLSTTIQAVVGVALIEALYLNAGPDKTL